MPAPICDEKFEGDVSRSQETIHQLGIDNIKADYQKAVYAGTLT